MAHPGQDGPSLHVQRARSVFDVVEILAVGFRNREDRYKADDKDDSADNGSGTDDACGWLESLVARSHRDHKSAHHIRHGSGGRGPQVGAELLGSDRYKHSPITDAETHESTQG